MGKSDWVKGAKAAPIHGGYYMSVGEECCGYVEMMDSGKRCEKCPIKYVEAPALWTEPPKWKPLEWSHAHDTLSSDVFLKAVKDIKEADRKKRAEYKRRLDRGPDYEPF